ncbi:MAG: hypothetical protein BHV88_12740 [Clostridiales bacterium 41_12_two_minus]|nr:MAG: hypothetical protein BHV88_12740 [Clostridiales bacterium 41_12_two_minus]
MQMQAGLPMQMQGNYLKEMEYEKDLDRMRELYPNEVKKIQKYVDEECDRMEYEGSLMFDEYPDKTMLSLVSKRIMDKIAQDSEKDEVETSECCGDSRRGGGLSDLVEVLLYNEMYRRRCRHRRCNRWW